MRTKPGRPPKPPEDRAVPLGMVRVPGRMLARLREAAEARGMTLTEWVQLALRHELER